MTEYCNSHGTQNVKNKVDAEPVKVALYYESICKPCRQLITYQLYPAYMTLYSTGILDITLVPFGNAYVSYQLFSYYLFGEPVFLFAPVAKWKFIIPMI